MELEVRLFATFREAVGRKTETIEVDDDATVGDALAALETAYGGLEGAFLEDGAIRPQLSVLKNGRDVVHLEGVETELESGDRLSLFPPVAGGTTGQSIDPAKPPSE